VNWRNDFAAYPARQTSTTSLLDPAAAQGESVVGAGTGGADRSSWPDPASTYSCKKLTNGHPVAMRLVNLGSAGGPIVLPAPVPLTGQAPGTTPDNANSERPSRSFARRPMPPAPPPQGHLLDARERRKIAPGAQSCGTGIWSTAVPTQAHLLVRPWRSKDPGRVAERPARRFVTDGFESIPQRRSSCQFR